MSDERHPMTEELTKQLGPLDPSAKTALDNGLKQTEAAGFKKGVGMATRMVQQEVANARMKAGIACYDQARQTLSERAQNAERMGDQSVAATLYEMAEHFGSLCAVVEKEQFKAKQAADKTTRAASGRP